MSNWFRKGPSDREMREEVEVHIAMRAEHDGTDPAEARKRLGNALQTQEGMRRVWVPVLWDALAQDVTFTVRSLSRSPSFAVTAILVMAVGLGAASALYSALDRILFRDLPYPASEQLVSVGITVPIADEELLLDGHYQSLWRPAPEPFSAVTATSQATSPCDLTEAEPVRLRCISVEENFLQVLDLRVFAGRDFLPEDDVPGAAPVALIRHQLWNSRFGADPAVVGRTIRIDGQSQRVIGILPPDFELPTLDQADVLFPLQLRPLETGGATARTRILRAYGRLLPGVTPAQALVRSQPVLDAMLELIPERFRPETAMTIQSLHQRQMGPSQRVAWLLLCAVGALLLIAGINVANLLLARTAVR